MNYFPSENIRYKTHLKENELFIRLSKVVGSKKDHPIKSFLNPSKNYKPYVGELYQNRFEVMRVINYKNSFLPKISGVIHNVFDGTEIQMKMRLHSFTLVFMIIWLGGVFLATIIILFSGLAQSEFSWFFLLPLGMFIFGYGLTMAGFKYEAKKSKQFFEELLEAAVSNT